MGEKGVPLLFPQRNCSPPQTSHYDIQNMSTSSSHRRRRRHRQASKKEKTREGQAGSTDPSGTRAEHKRDVLSLRAFGCNYVYYLNSVSEL